MNDLYALGIFNQCNPRFSKMTICKSDPYCYGPPLFGLYPNGLYPNGLFMIGLSPFGLPMTFGLSPFGLF